MLVTALISLLLILLGVLTVYLFVYRRQVRDIAQQLDFIVEHQSFKHVHWKIKPQELYKLIEACNVLLEQQRQLRQHFNEKNDEINATIVSLSHDIRTPLTSLAGYLQLAKRAEHLDEKGEHIEMAQSRLRQIHTLVDELFLYTKLRNIDYELELTSVDVTNVLNRRLLAFYDDFSERGLEPDIRLPKDTLLIESNESAVERVFDNVIKNYFTHGAGTLTVSYKETEREVDLYFCNERQHGDEIDIDTIFNRFYKEDRSRSSHSSGLGLFIVKTLVEKMNGRIRAELKNEQFCLHMTFTKMKNGRV